MIVGDKIALNPEMFGAVDPRIVSGTVILEGQMYMISGWDSVNRVLILEKVRNMEP